MPTVIDESFIEFHNPSGDMARQLVDEEPSCARCGGSDFVVCVVGMNRL